MEVLSPTDWGARVNYDDWNDQYVQKDKIFVHYNGGTPVAQGGVDVEIARLQAAENHHIDTRGWRGIAYGWAIGSTTGTIFRLRGWNLYGAHLGDIDEDGVLENFEGIPVYFTVGDDQPISMAAKRSFAELRTYLEQHVGTQLPVYGHRDTQQTTCPGDVLYAWVQSMSNGGWPMPDPMPDWARPTFEKAQAAGVFSDQTDPNGTVEAWELAVFLDRAGLLDEQAAPTEHNHDGRYAKKTHPHNAVITDTREVEVS